MSAREDRVREYLDELQQCGANPSVRGSTLSLTLDGVDIFESQRNFIRVRYNRPYPAYGPDGRATEIPVKSELIAYQNNDKVNIAYVTLYDIKDKEKEGYHVIPQKDVGSVEIPGKLTNDFKFSNGRLTINIDLS